MAVVLSLGLLAAAVIFLKLQSQSQTIRSVQQQVESLHLLEEEARGFSDAIGQVSPETKPSADRNIKESGGAISAVQMAYGALTEAARGTAFQDRVTALQAPLEDWKNLVTLRSVEATPSGDSRFSEERNAHGFLLDAVASISEAAHRLATERSQAVFAEAQADAAQLTTTLVTLFAVGALVIWGLSHRLLHNIQTLPVRIEHMIFDAHPTETIAAEGVGVNGSEQVIADFWTLAQKLRSRLSENEKIERMAFTDPLTGLPNRRGLLSFLDRLAENGEAVEDDSKIGLVHIDLDHFKTINDTMGHDAGDLVLRESTKRMSTAIRDSDLLARLGGDEFLVVATGIECEADLTVIADRLTAMFTTPIMYKQRACHVGISMGLVLGGQRGRVRDPKRLLINADMALFRAKSMGRGQYAIFNSAMADEARLRNERSIALGKALQDDAFHPWFQPMMNLSTGAVAGLELLCRWHDEERGILMPHEFLEDAEANSLMEEIGLRVLERAIAALQDWRMSGASVPTVHLNLSRTQLLSTSFVDRLSWTLDEANLPPGQFAIEVDERDCSARSSEVVIANVRRMRELGLQVVLDNFGMEQGCLTIIAPLGARMLKCSPFSFANMLKAHSYDNSVKVLSALEDAAKSYGITIGGKGVETEEESRLLSAAGIHLQQGDFLASVLGTDDTGRFLRGELDAMQKVAGQAS